jgi:hypothetical protein
MDAELEARIARMNRRTALLSTPAILLAGVGYAVFVGTGWSWPLFGWGLAIGPLWVIGIRAALRPAVRVTSASEAEAREATRRSWRLYRPVYISMIGMGAFAGIFSASSEVPFGDIVFSVLGVLGLLIPLLMLPSLKKKTAQERRAT